MLGEQGRFNFLNAYLARPIRHPVLEADRMPDRGARRTAFGDDHDDARYRVALPILPLPHPRIHRRAGQLPSHAAALDALQHRASRLPASPNRRTSSRSADGRLLRAEAKSMMLRRGLARADVKVHDADGQLAARPGLAQLIDLPRSVSTDHGDRGRSAFSAHVALLPTSWVPPSMPGVWVMAAGGLCSRTQHIAVRAETFLAVRRHRGRHGGRRVLRPLRCTRARARMRPGGARGREAVSVLKSGPVSTPANVSCKGSSSTGTGRARCGAYPGGRRW